MKYILHSVACWLLFGLSSMTVYAHGHHGGRCCAHAPFAVGVGIGIFAYTYPYYGYPYVGGPFPYTDPLILTPMTPLPTLALPESPPTPATGYYCPSAQQFYPQVATCSETWVLKPLGSPQGTP